MRIGFCATQSTAEVGDLFAGERGAVEGASPLRRAEFATGRWCARAALEQVGGPTGIPLLPDDAGAPLWPPDLVGSITHTQGWTGAVAARTGWRRGVRSLGLDAETASALPPGVIDVVASPRERADLERLASTNGTTPWDTVLFGAKEAVYKAWYPLGGVVLAHDAVEVRLTADGRFAAAVLVPTTSRAPRRVRGRWTAGPRVVVSLAVVD